MSIDCILKGNNKKLEQWKELICFAFDRISWKEGKWSKKYKDNKVLNLGITFQNTCIDFKHDIYFVIGLNDTSN